MFGWKVHPRISNPSKCKADNSVCKKYVSCQLERTGKNYLNSKFSGKLKGKSEEKEVGPADTQMKYGKGKCFPSKTKQLVKGKNSVRQVAPEKLTKNVMDNSFENKNNNLMHASLSRETLPTDRLQSDLWRTSLSREVEGKLPIIIEKGTCPKILSTTVEPQLLLVVHLMQNIVDNNRVPLTLGQKLQKLQTPSQTLTFHSPVDQIWSPGQTSLEEQFSQLRETQTVSVADQKVQHAQETHVQSADNQSPPLPSMIEETEGLGHQDLQEEEHPRNSDMTSNDTENCDVSLPDNHDLIDLKDVDFSSLVTDFNSDVLDECDEDKTEIDKLLRSLSPIKSPQKPLVKTTEGQMPPKKHMFQVPGGDIKAISISQLPEDFKNRMKEVVTCKTSTGSTTCLICLSEVSPNSKKANNAKTKDNLENNVSLTKSKLREMLKNRQSRGGPLPISSTFLPLVTTGLSCSKYARGIAQMTKDNEEVLNPMSSTGDDI